MSIAIVITLYCIAVLVFGVYMIAKVHLETSRITQEKDLISKIIENRERAIRHSGSAMKINTYFAILGLSPLIVGTIVYLFSKNGLFAILMGFMGFFNPGSDLICDSWADRKKFRRTVCPCIRSAWIFFTGRY